jgi:hypothetical protein
MRPTYIVAVVVILTDGYTANALPPIPRRHNCTDVSLPANTYVATPHEHHNMTALTHGNMTLLSNCTDMQVHPANCKCAKCTPGHPPGYQCAKRSHAHAPDCTCADCHSHFLAANNRTEHHNLTLPTSHPANCTCENCLRHSKVTTRRIHDTYPRDTRTYTPLEVFGAIFGLVLSFIAAGLILILIFMVTIVCLSGNKKEASDMV